MRRVLNLPLTWGSGAVLLTVVLGALAMVGNQRAADTVHDTNYAATKAIAQARIAGYDAKANESLTLVYQGSGKPFEDRYQADLANARQQLAAAHAAGVGDAAEKELSTWNTAHQAIRAADNGGNWIGAVGLATKGSGDSSKAFGAFADKTGSALEQEARAVADGLTSSHWLLVLLGWLTLAVGILAAALAWTGVGQRLAEYR
jgi:hypothetical protein